MTARTALTAAQPAALGGFFMERYMSSGSKTWRTVAWRTAFVILNVAGLILLIDWALK